MKKHPRAWQWTLSEIDMMSSDDEKKKIETKVENEMLDYLETEEKEELKKIQNG